jgi:hypothetical protein
MVVICSARGAASGAIVWRLARDAAAENFMRRPSPHARNKCAIGRLSDSAAGGASANAVSDVRRCSSALWSGRRRLAIRISCAAAVVLATQVEARWKPEYASQPPEVQQWYRNAELTAAAQSRFPFRKCCDHSDVVKTRFNVSRTSAGDEWYWLDGEIWRRIPDDIIHWDERAPNGQPTLFIYSGRETCFFPGDGGI